MSREILGNIIKEFSLGQFETFFRSKSNKLGFPDEPLYYEDVENKISAGRRLAQGKLEDGDLIICSFRVGKDLSERSGKKAQYLLGKKVMKGQQCDAGIFIFYDDTGNFRFSLIYPEYSGVRRTFNYYKRFTFFVSKEFTNKTFLKQIGEGDFSSIEKIKKCFTTEKVTEEFYKEIQTWFFYAKDKVVFPADYLYSNDDERVSLNLIRLITRIIFIWFMKQKGLIPDILFDPSRLQDIVKDFKRGKNYYNAILQNLFFATLNQKKEDRGWALNKGFQENRENYGVKTLYRYEGLFSIDEQKVSDRQKVLDMFKDIPFINGGLFDCLDKNNEEGKVIFIDGFSRNDNKRAKIDDDLFFHSQVKSIDLSQYGFSKNESFRGLIDILKTYNFTIDENSPIDQEIALDPELLGKVFENLLASYNPETATTARKSTGSYYTPREIVEYIVEETLLNYLKTRFPEMNEDDLRSLISYQDEVPQMDEDTKLNIIKSLDEIKVLDPACGSGAFPMGMLHRLVFILQKIDEKNEKWREIQFDKALGDSQKAFAEVQEKEKREEILKEINDTFDENINYPDYARKIFLIEKCIYGVDIQPIATEISRLRFFISLLIDQKVDKEKENSGIKPLPNLETRLVSANTLISLENRNQQTLKDIEVEKLCEELNRVRHKTFSTKTRREKLELQHKDKEIRKQIAKKLKEGGWPSESAEKIANFDLYDHNATADFFDPEWMFGVKDGFDIVIGNPPYGDLLTKGQKSNLRRNYQFSTFSDISSPFIERGFNLLKAKGNLSFIITYAITFNTEFSKTRQLLAKGFAENYIYTFDRDKCRIFGSMTQSVSILKCFNKCPKDKKGFFTSRMFRETPNIYSIEVTNCNNYLLPLGTNYDEKHRLPKIGEKINKEILNSLIINRDKVRNVVCNNGERIWIRTSGNYWYNAFDRKPYESVDISFILINRDYSNFLMLIMNSSLFYFWFRIYADGRHMNNDILQAFPLPIKEKILKNQHLLEKVRSRFMDKLFSVFEKGRNRFLTSRIKSEIDLLDLILGKYFYSLNYNQIIHILNYDSEVRGGMQLDESFATIVHQILQSKKQNPQADTSQFETQIDHLVYKLYDLTEEEIKIVEGGK